MFIRFDSRQPVGTFPTGYPALNKNGNDRI